MVAVYRLKVTQVEQVCFFELSWDQGRRLTARLPYPAQVQALYQSWQKIYLNYYRSALRGKSVASGQITAPADWQGQLVEAEAKLLYEFHQWLRSADLFDIRSEIGQQAGKASSGKAAKAVDVLITCDPMDLGRLPWEAWEITAEFGATQSIRIARSPVNIRGTLSTSRRAVKAARILVILGDDTGLDFARELRAIAALKRLATIEVVGWQPGTNIAELKRSICETIQAAAGWDMLLFFGHSNEANAVGGQIAIAPNTTLSLRELDPYVRTAKANGLKFALFNSCKGLDIASTLIDMGLNQVAVMREPIHNRVAQVFLIQFLQALARFEDVHTALQRATGSLRSERNLTYPSAHLVPSLFRHSDAVLFQLQPVGVRAKARSLLPATRWQVAALVGVAALSLLAPATRLLANQRLGVQALYRDVTGQIPQTTSPPVLLVQIDERSIREGISGDDISPIDRAYLSQIVDKLGALDVSVVGINYLLDYGQAENDEILSRSLQAAAEQDTRFVFAAQLKGYSEIGVRPAVASLDWAMQGYNNSPRGPYLRQLQYFDDCFDWCPFAYLLALNQSVEQTPLASEILPRLDAREDFRHRLLRTIERDNKDAALQQLYRRRLSFLTSLSGLWNQRWFNPLLDLSLPPANIYSSLSSYQLLNTSTARLQAQFDWQNQLVIVAPGGYFLAGVDAYQDSQEPPLSVAYWQWQQGRSAEKFTSGEVHAYAVHHFLNQHYIRAVPDSWMVLLGLVAAAGLTRVFYVRSLSPRNQQLSLLLLCAGYGVLSLQLYVGALLLLPWLLPTAVVLVVCLPATLTSKR